MQFSQSHYCEVRIVILLLLPLGLHVVKSPYLMNYTFYNKVEALFMIRGRTTAYSVSVASSL